MPYHDFILSHAYWIVFHPRCDIGNWRVSNITVEVANVNASFHAAAGVHLPPTKIVATTTAIPAPSGPLYYGGVSVQRSYRCNTTTLEVPLNIHAANVSAAWKSALKFSSLELEPFLVTQPLHAGAEPVFKDPLLCT